MSGMIVKRTLKKMQYRPHPDCPAGTGLTLEPW
jgi:hypothetical protein